MPTATTLFAAPANTPTSYLAPPPERRDADIASRVAALYPTDAAAAQRMLAAAACAALRAAGRPARLGRAVDRATCHTPDDHGGLLVLVPMGALWELDADLAREDGSDPSVWHVQAVDAQGREVLDDDAPWACPSVLWAVRAGLDPACAVALVAAALADPALAALLGGAG